MPASALGLPAAHRRQPGPAFLLAAVRLRSWRLAVAAAVYLSVTLVAMACRHR